MIRRFDVRTIRHRSVLRGRGWQTRSTIVREQKRLAGIQEDAT